MECNGVCLPPDIPNKFDTTFQGFSSLPLAEGGRERLLGERASLLITLKRGGYGALSGRMPSFSDVGGSFPEYPCRGVSNDCWGSEAVFIKGILECR